MNDYHNYLISVLFPLLEYPDLLFNNCPATRNNSVFSDQLLCFWWGKGPSSFTIEGLKFFILNFAKELKIQQVKS